MSTGPTHAVIGLASWGAIALIALSRHMDLTVETLGAGAALASGAALFPDLDHPPATVSRSFGPVTRVLSHGMENLSQGIRNVVRLPADKHRNGGHRTFTHTIVFALLAGVLTTSLVSMNNKWVTGILLFFFCGLSARGLMHEWNHRADTFTVVVVSFLVTALCWRWVEVGPDRPEWCGIAVITGCLAHLIGDAITEEGVPALWPIPLGARLWRSVGLPTVMRYRTGGKVELTVIAPLSTVIAAWLGAIVLQRMGVVPWLSGVPLVPHFNLDWVVASH